MRQLHHFIFISFFAFGLFSCDNVTDNSSEAVEDIANSVLETIDSTDSSDAITSTDTTPIEADSTADNTTEVIEEIEEPETPEVQPETPSNDPALDRFSTGISDARMSLILETIAQELEAKKLKYDHTLGQDCSGIYHKVKDLLQEKMPAFKAFQYPQYTKERNTRQIAHWYHEKGNLFIVEDALAAENRIRPGSVLFFGRTDEKYSGMNVDMLSNPGKWVHDKSIGKGKIFHIAVVTATKKDANGKSRFTIMHGRNSRHPASRTEVNYDGPGGYVKQFAKFPFGNWNQQLVAIANIATPQ